MAKETNTIHYGSDAIHMLTLLSTPSGIFNRINYYVFSTKPGAKIVNLIGKACRTLILKLLGIRYIENLTELLAQEDEIQLPYFNNQTAWELGNLIKLYAEERSVSVAIEVYAFEHVLFSYFMPGTNKDHHDWIKRKRQSVMRFGHSSYYQGQYNAAKNRDFEAQPHIDPKEYCVHGGSFPLRIKNSGLVGAVTVSGLPQEMDHQLAVDAVRKIIEQQH